MDIQKLVVGQKVVMHNGSNLAALGTVSRLH